MWAATSPSWPRRSAGFIAEVAATDNQEVHAGDLLIKLDDRDYRAALAKADIADGLHERVGLRREDVFISLVQVRKENWSFGNGLAQYA